MKKKVYTMQDIADAAGVSKATVSYVLNNKKGHRISETTQKKILQIANLYNYIPNMSAKFLSKDNFKLIGVLIGTNDFSRMQSFDSLFYLQNSLITYGYRPILINYKDNFEYLDLAYDAIIVINFDTKKIENITNATFAPIILSDIIFESPLFFYMYNGYQKAFQLALKYFKTQNNDEKPILIYNKYNNNSLNSYIEHTEFFNQIYYFDNVDNYLKYLETHKNCSFIIMNEFLGSLAERILSEYNFIVICDDKPKLLQKNTKYIHFSNEQKYNTLIPLMMDLINKNDNINEKKHGIELDYVGDNLL